MKWPSIPRGQTGTPRSPTGSGCRAKAPDDASAVGEREGLQPLAEMNVEVPLLLGVVGDDLVQRRRSADGGGRGLAAAGRGHRASAADHQVDVLGVVVQFDACVVGLRGGALIVECPSPAQRETVVGKVVG